jgi:hypothetical protein
MLLDWLPNILREVATLARTQALPLTRWPVSIEPMDPKEIAQDEKNGGGHGVYLPGTEEIRLNSTMPPLGIILNLIHELWHHVDPRADEWYINSVVVPFIYDKLTGEVLDPDDWADFRGHSKKWQNWKRRKK